jgi:hypothetical protein
MKKLVTGLILQYWLIEDLVEIAAFWSQQLKSNINNKRIHKKKKH